MIKCRKMSYVSKGQEGQKTRGINGGLWADEKREGCDFKGRKLNPVKIQSPLCWEVWFLEGQRLPLVQDRHHQSRCRCCGRGCWLCPAALWPEFCWGAGTQKGAGRRANNQKDTKWPLRLLSRIRAVLLRLLTCSSFSAVGLFFGFLVRASLTKWWKLFVLLVQN